MNSKETLSLILSLPSRSSKTLYEFMGEIQDETILVDRLESRTPNKDAKGIDYLVSFNTATESTVSRLLQTLKCKQYQFKLTNFNTYHQSNGHECSKSSCPCFPTNIKELDLIEKPVMMYGVELSGDHKGFQDSKYRQRRMAIAALAENYKLGQEIPRISYTTEEKTAWASLYTELRKLYARYACKTFWDNFILLEQQCGYSKNDIPQLEDISNFLKGRTGFRLSPVGGYLSPKAFLTGLAFRVYFATQYMRHPSDPFYAPEPDVCHEVMGHIPFFADPEFARLSQEIGLASLGASDQDMNDLAVLYFYTAEFGLCKEDGQMKAYGAGLLSSVAELKHAMQENPHLEYFNYEAIVKTKPIISAYQKVYFYSDSLKKAIAEIRAQLRILQVKHRFLVTPSPSHDFLKVVRNGKELSSMMEDLKGTLNLLDTGLHVFP